MMSRIPWALAIVFVASACGPEHVLPRSGERPDFKALPVNYQTLSREILSPRCLSCHVNGSPSSARDLPFYPYQSLMADPRNRWAPPAQTSRVVRAITRMDKHQMPPPGEERVSAEELNFIMEWIDAGRPEF